MVKSSVLINKNIFAQRFLGWFFINMLIAFMINNILNLAYKIPFAIELITKNELLSLLPILIYLIAFGLSLFISYINLDKSYKWDSDLLHRFNLYFISKI